MAGMLKRLFRKRGEDHQYVEGVVCNAQDLEENGMKVCELGDGGRVLVVKQEGKISALGTKCSHYGAPLLKGVLGSGHVRCPWHGACFNILTGDIEDFPGLDGIPCYQVKVKGDGDVVVRANKAELREDKYTKPLPKRNPANKDVIVVLGGGGAGASCVETLRKCGYDGRIVLASREKHLPYDRPSLGKKLHVDVQKIQLRSAEFYRASDIEVLLEHQAVEVNTTEKKVRFGNGAELAYTKLVIATGTRPRRLSVPGADLDGICVLRSPEDCNGLAARVRGGHVVVLGSSFIGMEVASSCVAEAASVTVVGLGSEPYVNVLGGEIGAMLRRFCQSKGITFKMGCSIKEFKGEDNQLSQVVLTDGSELPASVCVLAIGVTPNTEFLAGVVNMDKRGYVDVDKRMQTSAEGVLAAGDVAAVPLPLLGGARLTVGHWQLALYLGMAAGESAAGRAVTVNTVPFFWTAIFGKSIRYAGHCASFDDILYEGSVEEQAFAAFFCSGRQVQGVATLGRDPEAARWAEHMQRHGFPTKDEVLRTLNKTKP